MSPIRVPSERRAQIGENGVEHKRTESGGGDGPGEGGQLGAARGSGVAGAELSANEADVGAVSRGGERRRCNTGTAGGDRIVPTRRSFAVGCSIGCRNVMRISVRRWRVSTWRATTG